MTINEAIAAIEEAGFSANYWAKGEKKRIYIDFNFNGSHRTGGYLCKESSSLVAAPCGKKTKKYQSKLNAFLELPINWGSNKTTISHRQAAARAAYEISIESLYNEFQIGL